eukprot:scaffold156665_cov40-Tisochrysis_lutea.AAC.3
MPYIGGAGGVQIGPLEVVSLTDSHCSRHCAPRGITNGEISLEVRGVNTHSQAFAKEGVPIIHCLCDGSPNNPEQVLGGSQLCVGSSAPRRSRLSRAHAPALALAEEGAVDGMTPGRMGSRTLTRP